MVRPAALETRPLGLLPEPGLDTGPQPVPGPELGQAQESVPAWSPLVASPPARRFQPMELVPAA
jgi:hypothetical protein